jgi:hypothetical protein
MLLGGPEGLIAPDDIVLIKVNAQWKHRGATNTDLVRGLIQRLLDYPGGFRGEVVIFENGQGRGSLACDNTANYSDDSVRANANDERQSFQALVDTVFRDPRVSACLFDRLRTRWPWMSAPPNTFSIPSTTTNAITPIFPGSTPGWSRPGI